jgi:hypothetical protein
MKQTMQNSKCAIEYRENDKEIFARDLTDRFNEPAIYTKTKRGLRNAWVSIQLTWNDNTTMHDVLTILQANKIRCHYWCMVD